MADEMQEVHTDTADMTAGEMFRMARTTGRRKREIPTIAKQLCIREEFLQALEDGDYTALPETVYILGFARNYAMELGIDPDTIIAKIKRELGIVPTPVPVTNVPERIVRFEPEDVAKKSDSDTKNTDVGVGMMMGFVKKYWMWIVSGVVLVILICVAVLVVRPRSDAAMPNTQSGVVTNSSAGDGANVAANAPVAPVEPAFKLQIHERYGTENRKGAEIVIQAIRDSWIKIEDGRGKTVFSRVLVSGDVYYVPAGNKHRATFGDAGAMDIWVRGELAPKVGKDHERKSDVSLNPDKLMPATTGAVAA